jgi:hypothetical protein
MSETAVVITSINPPTAAMRLFARGCAEHQHALIVAGDTASPTDFALPGAIFLNVTD